jgi:hypothetical protein
MKGISTSWGHGMNRRILSTTLLVLSLSLFGSAQGVNPAPTAKARKVTISGRVSDDGKAIVAEGRAWAVSNVEKLRDYLGKTVTVKALRNPISNEIEVVSTKLATVPTTASARLGDSAFRR